MSKSTSKFIYIFAGLVIAFFALSLSTTFFFNANSQNTQSKVDEVQSTTTEESSDTFSYKGSDGVDAFTLLEEQAEIEVSKSGLIDSINGRKADEKKREFWSFYVNGELANVGPKDYITKSSDLIEWKIETY